MARGKGSNSTPLRQSDAIELIRRMDTGRMRLFLEQAFPESQVRQVSGQLLLMRCPTPGHEDKNPSCFVDMKRGRVQCKSCFYTTRNILQMLQDCLGWSYAEGLSQIHVITGIRPTSEKTGAAYEALDQHREALRLMAKAFNLYLVKMISPPEADKDDSTAYDAVAQQAARPAMEWLFEHRKHSKDMVAHLPYGIWPPLQHLVVMCTKIIDELVTKDYSKGLATRFPPDRRAKILDRVKTIAESAGPEWTHSVAYVTGHDFTTPARIRLRRPEMDDKKLGNFKMLPGYHPDESHGFYGLYAPDASGSVRRDARNVRMLMVEGENDQTSVAEGIIGDGIHGWWVIGTCGTENVTDALAEAGVDTAYLLLDHPDPDQGRGEIWLRGRLLSARIIEPRVFVAWKALRDGNGFLKDADEVIKEKGFAHFRQVVLDEPEKSFVSCEDWAFDRAMEDAQDMDETREKTAVAVKYGECLLNPSQLASFLDRVAKPLGVAPGAVRAQIVQGQDDEEGFISRLADTLAHDLHFLYKEDTVKGSVIHAYHKETQRPVRFPADDGFGAMSALSNVVGDMHTFFSQRVGMPAWLYDERADRSSPLVRELQKPLADYTRIAMQRVFHNLPSKDECEFMGLGPHMTEVDGVTIQYVNTGKRVFRARYRDDQNLQWEVLTGPSDGRLLFAVQAKPMNTVVDTVDDLEWGNTVTITDLQAALGTLVKIYECWGLKHGKKDALLMALLTFHLCAPHFCTEKINIGVTGATGSGKSKLMAPLCGGQHPELQLVDWAIYQSNYSVASLYNHFNGSSCLMALDEFTADGMHQMKSRQVEDVIEMLRQAIFPGGAQVRRMIGGVAQVLRVHTNAMTTSTHPPRDMQDINRRLDVETLKHVGHKDPAVAIHQIVTPEEFRQLRRVLNLGIFHFQKQYARRFTAISRELATSDLDLPFKVETRFLRNFAGPATMCELLGADWKKFVVACTVARETSLNAYAHATPTNILFDTLLRTNGVRLGANYTSIMALLAEPDKWPVLNGTMSGALYHNEAGLLVIDWIASTSNGGVLFRTEPWCREQFHRLKYLLDQHATAVPAADYERLGVMNFTQACGLSADQHTITVLHLSAFVAKVRDVSQRKTTFGEPRSAPGQGPADQSVPPGLRMVKGGGGGNSGGGTPPPPPNDDNNLG